MPSSPLAASPGFAEIAEIFRYVLRDPGLELTPRTTPDDVAA